MGLKILLVAGGTGGHIWPAISFGKWINNSKPDISLNYICGNRPLEIEIYNSAEVEPNILPVDGSPLSGTPYMKLKRIKGQFMAFSHAKTIIINTKPDICILFGGYVSLPVLFACMILKIQVVMHEQNAYAGKVTRLASMLGVDILSGWSECIPLQPEKYTTTGVPVRMFEEIAPELAWSKLELPEIMPIGPKVVVFSGSLGSQSIKDLICEAASKKEFRDWTFILPALTDLQEKVGNNVYLLPKTWNASLLFSLADMAVIRAGASTLTEVGTLGIPSLVIPWREAADDHQYYNALAFLAGNSGILWGHDGKYSDFERNLTKLHDIWAQHTQINESKLYNSAGKICENFWLALSSHF